NLRSESYKWIARSENIWAIQTMSNFRAIIRRPLVRQRTGYSNSTIDRLEKTAAIESAELEGKRNGPVSITDRRRLLNATKGDEAASGCALLDVGFPLIGCRTHNRDCRARHTSLKASRRVHTAYHEAGHALVARLWGYNISEVTIVPNDDYRGRVS